ncbi:hypothetical protein [Candidatus Galacturonibacter soehngenii]|uniref:Uncharacterized protein n=1 Tax=Candidatus Galacturonatibacter soehngenii TaxID=2307010 RepID=A0A7V7QJ53_9FIRM|nr:hypothetical protein [Candidatus Galacturonibacter soehngenii]KAB1437582.1 hypothetical protein F7O84_08220 [Candidatus Galacturonibacter soehngenii]
MYQMINDKLRIMSCGIDDLSDKRKEVIVKVFNGDSIEALSMFYDQEDDMIVLNYDNKNYEFIKSFAENYLEMNREHRGDVIQRISNLKSQKHILEMVNVLDSVYWIRKCKQEEEEARKFQKILKRQSVAAFGEAAPMLEALRRVDTCESEFFFDWNPFMFGYIQGVRSERDRRKKAALKKAGALNE